jgi:broad specificity phosphatase PhoE
LKQQKENDLEYQSFLFWFEISPTHPKTVELAERIAKRLSLAIGDHETPLAEGAEEDAIRTGHALSLSRTLPDVIYVSPYVRTHATLSALTMGWPSLAEVPTVEDVRLREQEHGLSLLYNDWRVFLTLHPQQYRLRLLEGRYFYRYPQGESVPDVQMRLKDFQETLIREHAGKDVLVVTHHLVILALRMNLERFDWKEFLRIDEEEKPINCGVTTYTSKPGDGQKGRGKLRLTEYNVCHFKS